MTKTRIYGQSHYPELNILKQIIAREAVVSGLCDVGDIGNDIIIEETSNYFYHFTITVADVLVTLTVSIGKMEHKVHTNFARISSVKGYSDTPWCFSPAERRNDYANPYAVMKSLIHHLGKLHELFNEVNPNEKTKPNNG